MVKALRPWPLGPSWLLLTWSPSLRSGCWVGAAPSAVPCTPSVAPGGRFTLSAPRGPPAGLSGLQAVSGPRCRSQRLGEAPRGAPGPGPHHPLGLREVVLLCGTGLRPGCMQRSQTAAPSPGIPEGPPDFLRGPTTLCCPSPLGLISTSVAKRCSCPGLPPLAHWLNQLFLLYWGQNDNPSIIKSCFSPPRLWNKLHALNSSASLLQFIELKKKAFLNFEKLLCLSDRPLL